MQPYPCYPTVEVPREKGEVPHHLPGENPFLEEYAKKHNLPQNAMRGGAETALPEFMERRVTEPCDRPDPEHRGPETGADPPTTTCTHSTCRATCGCFTAAASMPRSRSARRASSSWTR